jgi:Ca2+/H+ antiporter
MLHHSLKVSPILPKLQEEVPNEDATEEDEEIEISMWEAITWLAVLTIWISVLSEYLVNAIEVFSFFPSTKRKKKISVVCWML